MFKFNNSLSFLLLFWCGVAGAQSVEGPRKTESFDKNWLFTKGDAGGAEKRAIAPVGKIVVKAVSVGLKDGSAELSVLK